MDNNNMPICLDCPVPTYTPKSKFCLACAKSRTRRNKRESYRLLRISARLSKDSARLKLAQDNADLYLEYQGVPFAKALALQNVPPESLENAIEILLRGQ